MKQTQFYDCGPTALQSVLLYYGIEVRLDELFERLGTTDNGTHPKTMVSALHSYGIKTDAGQMSVDDIRNYITQNTPVILLLQAWAMREHVDWRTNYSDGHYVVAIGFDEERIVFEDPWVYHRTYLPTHELDNRWHDLIRHDNERYEHYGIAAYGLPPAFHPETMIRVG